MLDRPGLLISWTCAALTLALTTACSEAPSYLVRWKLTDDPTALDDPESVSNLDSVKQCADVGISTIRVTTWRADNTIEDQREFACFGPSFMGDDVVVIPALPAGEYTVEVQGLRRSGEPWACILEPDGPESPCIAFAEAEVAVGEGLLETVSVALLVPPQCDDGIDNDRDGRVDGKDPACILNPDGPESGDASVTLFQLSVSFLDSPAVRPANVGVAGLLLEVDGELLAEVAASELDLEQWPFRVPLQTETYAPGLHDFSIVAVDANNTPLTSAFAVEFAVSDEAAGFVLEQFDFDVEQFLAPIIEPIAATINLLLDPGDQTGPPCALGGSIAGQPVEIERTWFRVSDSGGQSVDAATLGLGGLGGGGMIMPVDEADGWISFACPTSMVVSDPLVWGGYTLEVEARIGDAVCFTSDGAQDLAPAGGAGAQNFYLQRVVDEQGVPPAGCEECVVDSDCSGQICDAGICKDKTP